MKFYISGPSDKGEGPYVLLTEEGEVVASHFCSSYGFAQGDLTTTFGQRRFDLESRFGPFTEHEVRWLGDEPQEFTDELRQRNEAFYEASGRERE